MINIQEQMLEPPVQDQDKNEESEEEGEEDDGDERQVEESFSKDHDRPEEPRGLEEEAAATDMQEKHPQVLNLNNEVVKMRKEVKRVRALIIRKLARQIAALKKKKGKDTEMERHQRRAARLLEEVHIMKSLPADQVTKTALQKNLNFDQVFKNPKSSLTDRAVTRIATHPQFSKKIDDIKASVKAFGVERRKGGGKAKGQRATLESAKNHEEQEKSGSRPVELPEVADGKEEVEELKDMSDSKAAKSEKKTEKRSADAAAGAGAAAAAAAAPALSSKRSLIGGPESVHSRDVIRIPNSKAAENDCNLQSATVPPPRRAEDAKTDAESDGESAGGEEKEYFDDSTEERFYKQSSQSEDSEDDFFVGKVSKVKKRRKKPKMNEVEKEPDVKKDSSGGGDKLQRELDQLESRLRPKTTTLQSVFCPSLARRKGGGGQEKSRGFGKVKGQKKVDGFTHQQEKAASSKYSKPFPGGSLPGSNTRGFASSQRGVGRGRREAPRQQDPKAGGVFSSQPALHPSWEASRRRKEQQGQILAFQGKKIKFDDDD